MASIVRGFQQVLTEGLVALAIPGTATRRAENRHDVDETGEGDSARGPQRRVQAVGDVAQVPCWRYVVRVVLGTGTSHGVPRSADFGILPILGSQR
jgi:hypothetical protein